MLAASRTPCEVNGTFFKMNPKRETIVIWGRHTPLRLRTVIDEVDSYFGHEPHLVSVRVSRDSDAEDVEVRLHFQTFQNGRLQDLPGDRGDANSQTTNKLYSICEKLGLKWVGNSVFQNEIKLFRFGIHGRNLSFTEQAVLLVRKLDPLLVRPEYQGEWINTGEVFQEPYVVTHEHGREPYFKWLLRKQMETPVEEV